MIDSTVIDQLDAEQLRALAKRLVSEVRYKQATIDKLTHEMAVLKRLKFAARSESFTGEQRSLLEEAIEEDLESLACEIEAAQPDGSAPTPKQ
ncbi:MAG: transposase, partial [Phycisphaerae bacterium]